VQAVRALKALGANVREKDKHAYCPMHSAMFFHLIEDNCRIAICMELPPTDIVRRNASGETPLDMAVKRHFTNVIIWMLQQCTWTLDTLKSAKKHAARNTIVKAILDEAEAQYGRWSHARAAFVAACVFA
jgi:hypothetical protein